MTDLHSIGLVSGGLSQPLAIPAVAWRKPSPATAIRHRTTVTAKGKREGAARIYQTKAPPLIPLLDET
ncbi:hypothetical protein DY251_11160 [Mesorhizobium denitrificans]|uniref:Uncharacterized protein n=1 Tax=Mesorhizobium denitrificans TaxID=2294114 RepID=A0A371XEU2_9HYPH|nr:hypothetical protein DY251_11160 [Mesorhizobium denitrificans]